MQKCIGKIKTQKKTMELPFLKYAVSFNFVYLLNSLYENSFFSHSEI